ncbi:MAG: 23S rRNA (guanosine(2251)-2'-O)-methyltransferase RlmB [Pseudomonadota bacterium]
MSWVYGHHAVAAQLAQRPERARVLYLQKGRRDPRTSTLAEQARAAGVRVELLDKRRLDQRCEGSHQGVALECQAVAVATEAELLARLPSFGPRPLLLVLDEITDPRNLGACLRSAAAAGVDAVVLPKRGSAPLNELVEKTAAGALAELLIVEVSNLARCLSALKDAGLWLFGAADDGAEAWDRVDFAVPAVLILGNEATGLRRLTREHCDYLVRIPMQGAVSSLNVSVATGVLLFEAVRQRSQRSS